MGKSRPIKKVKPPTGPASKCCDGCEDGLVECKTVGGGSYLCGGCAEELERRFLELNPGADIEKENKLVTDLSDWEWFVLRGEPFSSKKIELSDPEPRPAPKRKAAPVNERLGKRLRKTRHLLRTTDHLVRKIAN